MLRTGLLVVLAVLVSAGEPPLPKPDIPDPIGLGERLALIDHLRGLGATVPAGATYEELVALYWQRQAAVRPAVADDDALTTDRRRRLRAELKERHGIVAAEDANEDELRASLVQAREGRARAGLEQAVERGDRRDRPRSVDEVQRHAASDLADHTDRLTRLDRELAAQNERAPALEVRRAKLHADHATANAELARLVAIAEAAKRKQDDADKAADKGRDTANRTAAKAAGEAAKSATAAAERQAELVRALASDHDAVVREQQKLTARAQDIDAQKRVAERAIAAIGTAANAAARELASAAGPAALAPTDANALANRLRQAVVLVAVEDRGAGSGFVVSARGHIVTNAHVLGDAPGRVVALWDAGAGRKPARLRVVQVAKADDLALLQIDGDAVGLEPLALREGSDLTTPLIAAGFPLAAGVANALGTAASDIVLSRGTLTALRRHGQVVQWLQHDCAIASGSSGGPVVDAASGAVLGVNTMVLDFKSDERTAGAKVNLAVPTRTVLDRFAAFLAP